MCAMVMGVSSGSPVARSDSPHAETFYMRVGFTVERPIVPDQFFTNVVISTDRGIEDARLLAAQWVGWGSEMVTSVEVLFVEI